MPLPVSETSICALSRAVRRAGGGWRGLRGRDDRATLAPQVVACDLSGVRSPSTTKIFVAGTFNPQALPRPAQPCSSLRGQIFPTTHQNGMTIDYQARRTPLLRSSLRSGAASFRRSSIGLVRGEQAAEPPRVLHLRQRHVLNPLTAPYEVLTCSCLRSRASGTMGAWKSFWSSRLATYGSRWRPSAQRL